MNQYEEKQAARKERYEELAEKAKGESAQRYENVKEMIGFVPFGQPILVGHHSEGRHRAMIKKMDTNMRKSVEAEKKAEYYERKAEGVGEGGVSSDDPEAILKLKKQAEELEANREQMKKVNAQFKKGGWLAVELKEELKLELATNMTRFQYDAPFPSYSITNSGANLRRIKERIVQLERTAGIEKGGIKGEGFEILWDSEINRVKVVFETIPEAEVREKLKGRGFKWSPKNKAWIRMANESAWYAAKGIMGVA